MMIKKITFIMLTALLLSSCETYVSGNNNSADISREHENVEKGTLSVTAADIAIMNGIEMKVTNFAEGILTLHIENHSGSAWSYGKEFNLSKKTGDVWSQLEWPEGTAWIMVIYTIPNGGEKEITCDTELLGKLEAGEYKLEKNGLEVYFILG